MFEFLLNNSNTDSPTFLAILITVLSAFFLSSLVMLTYELTSRNVVRPVNFLQAMALIAIVSATIMQAIGDSLARGIGMLGALAIIRFRTKLDNPRNITFMFMAIACGIACGVFGFVIAFVGTIGFCCAAFIMRFSPILNESELTGNLRIRIPTDGEQEMALTKILKKFCRRFEIQELRLIKVKMKVENNQAPVSDTNTEELTENDTVIDEPEIDNTEVIKYKELIYIFSLKKQKGLGDLSDEVENIPEARGIRFRFDKQRTIL
jgi:uncharacterized membrane protein YhiD involved in acid resistance